MTELLVMLSGAIIVRGLFGKQLYALGYYIGYWIGKKILTERVCFAIFRVIPDRWLRSFARRKGWL